MLMELIAEHGIVEEIGEVVEEIELTLDGVSIRLPIARVIGPGDARRERKTIGVAAIARVFRAIESDQRDRTLRDLVGRVPLIGIGHAGDGQPVERGALGVAHHSVELAHIIRMDPGPVIAASFSRDQHGAITDLG